MNGRVKEYRGTHDVDGASVLSVEELAWYVKGKTRFCLRFAEARPAFSSLSVVDLERLAGVYGVDVSEWSPDGGNYRSNELW